MRSASMSDHGDCVCKVLVWISVPIWLPIYAIIVPTYRCSRKLWRQHIGPIREYSVPKPVPRGKAVRHQLSLQAMPKLEETNPLPTPSLGAVVVAAKVQPKSCGFWKLPIEIRMMIWKELLLLAYGGAVEVCLNSNRADKINLYSYDAVRNLEATVLRVNRQLYVLPTPPLTNHF